MLSCVPAQSNASTLSSKLSNAISKVHDKIDSAFSKVKSKFTKSKTEEENKATEAKSSETETEKKSVFKKALDKARNVLKESFNMNFLSSVPVIFWKKTFNKMFDYAQTTIDDMNLEHNGEIITRDDFQDDKALHIKKSAELALHIKSLFGSSVFAYGVTLAVGGIKELIDSSFLNPNGGRCWEDFYADMVGASAVFGEEAFDKKT
jgi:sugar-specific transcriptional regulator TrmB